MVSYKNPLQAWARKQYVLRQVFAAGLFLIFSSLFWIGCGPKVVRVPVSEEDILRANKVANEGDIAFDRKDFYAALIKYLEAVRINPNSEYLYNRLPFT
jgi:hypothetical protein